MAILVGNIYAGLSGGGGGGLTGANSGLSVSGTDAILGGSTILANTTIGITGKFFGIEGDNTGLGINDATGQTHISSTDPSGIPNSFIDLITSGVKLLTSPVLGVNTSLEITGTGGIIAHDDSNNIGLTGDVLFPLAGDSNQYLQQGNLQAAMQAFVDVPGLNASSSILVVAVPSGDGMYEINAYGLMRPPLVGDSVTFNYAYTDVLGNAISGQFGVIDNATPNSAFTTIMIKAKAFTSISITTTYGAGPGTSFYDAGAFIRFIGA